MFSLKFKQRIILLTRKIVSAINLMAHINLLRKQLKLTRIDQIQLQIQIKTNKQNLMSQIPRFEDEFDHEHSDPDTQIYGIQLQKAINHLRLIFLYYCNYGDRSNCLSMKQQSFKRLLTDAQLIYQQHNQVQMRNSKSPIHKDCLTSYDILYQHYILIKNQKQDEGSNSYKKNSRLPQQNKKQRKNGVSFEDFMKMIPKIAQIAYPQQKQFKRVRKLVLVHFETLYEFIVNSTELGNNYLQLKSKHFNQKCFTLLKEQNNKHTLNCIYKYYFPKSMPQSQSHGSNFKFKRLSSFMKQMDLTPTLVQYATVYISFKFVEEQKTENAFSQYFQSQATQLFSKSTQNLREQEKRQSFTFFKFLKFIILISKFTHSKISQDNNLSEVRKLSNLLERLIISHGYQKLSVLYKLKMNVKQTFLSEIQNNLRRDKKSEQDVKINNSIPSKSISDSQKYQKKIIKQLFEKLCIYGDNIGKQILSDKKFIDFILQMNLFGRQNQHYQEQQSETFSRQSKNYTIIRAQLQILIKGKGRLTFQNFEQILQEIIASQQLQRQTVIQIIKNFNQRIAQSGDSQITLMKQLKIKDQQSQKTPLFKNAKKAKVVKISQKILQNQSLQRYLQQIFNHYASLQQSSVKQKLNAIQIGGLNLIYYSQFLHDFQVSPFLVSKQQVTTAFYSHNKLRQNQGLILKEFINSFESLFEFATERLKQSETQFSLEKGCILILQTMACSKGHRIVKNKIRKHEKLGSDSVNIQSLLQQMRVILWTAQKGYNSNSKKVQKRKQKDILKDYLK